MIMFDTTWTRHYFECQWMQTIACPMPSRPIMTLSNGNISRVSGLLWRESTGHRRIPVTKASNAELWYFLWWAWTSDWANSQDSGDLRRHCAHYDASFQYMASAFNIFVDNIYPLSLHALNYLIQWDRDKMPAILQTFSNSLILYESLVFRFKCY